MDCSALDESGDSGGAKATSLDALRTELGAAMGFCGGGESEVIDPALRRTSETIARAMDEKMKRSGNLNKLLLLGAGQSGKSTVFKQMNMLENKDGYTVDELRQFKYIIHRNAIDGIKTILEAMPTLGLSVDESAEDAADQVLLWDSENLNPELATTIALLWADGGVRVAFKRRAEYQLNDSVEYFMEHVLRLGASDYLPTTQDVLRARVRTSGVVSKEFSYKNTNFQVYDVGGQRSERRRWLGLFDHVTVICFVAALSEYDQVLAEDSTKNRMMEALDLFEQIANSHHFTDIQIILFLNKRDLFAEKIKHVDPKKWFPEYTGGLDYANAEKFFKESFESRIHDRSHREIYSYSTCATDTENIQVVFQSVHQILSDKNASQFGIY